MTAVIDNPAGEVEWATEVDLRAAVRNALGRLGCTFAELKAMHESGDYASLQHRLAWVAIGDLEMFADERPIQA